MTGVSLFPKVTFAVQEGVERHGRIPIDPVHLLPSHCEWSVSVMKQSLALRLLRFTALHSQ